MYGVTDVLDYKVSVANVERSPLLDIRYGASRPPYIIQKAVISFCTPNPQITRL